jgi:hypothetical protein
MLDEEVEKD